MLTIDCLNCTLDFEQDGKHFGNIELGYSDNRHAFAKIPVPVVCIKNGSGPTLLLVAGNHGDEYEGITALLKLANKLKAEDVQGRVIIVPMMNAPAMKRAIRGLQALVPIRPASKARKTAERPTTKDLLRRANFFSW